MNIKYALKTHLKTYQRTSYVADGKSVDCNGAILDCAYGINPYGYSNEVMMAKVLCAKELNDYPRYPYLEAREDIVDFWKKDVALKIENIRLGNGSMGILSTINKMFIANNTPVLGYAPQFTEYIAEVECLGGCYDYVRLDRVNNFRFDTDGLIARIKGEHSLIYLDNPNNPTGQVIPLSEIRTIVRKAEAVGSCVIVDEAYGDFMDKSNSAISLTEEFENLFVVRSFSKGFGLAGIRIGYLVCNRTLLHYYKKVETPFTVADSGCRIMQMAMKDVDFIKESVEKIRAAKKSLYKVCKRIKIWHTHENVPIMVLEHPDRSCDLQRLFLTKGVLTEAGCDFRGVGKNAVRLRIPVDIEKLFKIIKEIDSKD